MRRVLTSPVIWTLIGGMAALGLLYLAMPLYVFIRFLSYALILVASGLTLGYVPPMWDALREKRFTTLGLYATGIGMMWMAVLINRVWAEVSTIIAGTRWTGLQPIVAFYLSLFLVSGLLQLVAPGIVEGRVPRRSMVRLGLVVGGALAAALVLWSLDR